MSPVSPSITATMASGHSRLSTPQDAVPSRYRNIRYKSDLYVQDVPAESYARDAAEFKVVTDAHEAIIIDNGEPTYPSLGILC